MVGGEEVKHLLSDLGQHLINEKSVFPAGFHERGWVSWSLWAWETGRCFSFLSPIHTPCLASA